MGKKVPITDRIKGLIAKNTDNSVDVSTISVYECISINSLPISKKGTLFDGAVMDAATMQEMADYVNNGGAVPLHNLHDQGEDLPVGRVFYSEVGTTMLGTTELRSLFYLPNTEEKLISKLESNVVDEVSVGFRPKHINCSKCGFDFLGANATWENIWTLTCDENHTIGEDGVFAYTKGLDKWMELSLVSKGAANNAKILARTKQLLGEQEYNQLAASGIRPEATTLYSIATKEPTMDLTALVAQLSEAKGSVMLKDAELLTLKATVTSLTAENTALKAAQTPEAATLKTQLDASEATAKTAIEFIRKEADRLAVASGTEKPAETADLSVLTASIEASRAKLSALPTGGASNPQGQGSGNRTEVASAASFKTTR